MRREMKKPKSKAAKGSRARKSGSRKPVDLDSVRRQIAELVGGQALAMVETTMSEVDKGHYAAMKYLFEIAGLFPGEGEPEKSAGEDSLAKTLLRRLGLLEMANPENKITKDSPAPPVAGVVDAVE